MKNNFTELERRRLVELAREYRNLGYTVMTQPTKEQLPSFLSMFQPDMIARNEQESVVFMVKSRRTLASSSELEGIAQAVQGKKGWQFDLVVTNPREKAGLITASDHLLNRSEVITRLQESQELSEQEHGEAAFLLAWSATEAVLRTLAVKENVSPERSTSESITKNLFAYGFIDREQYETLIEGVKVRNSIVHGYQDPPAYALILNKLQRITQQLLNEEQFARIHA